MKRQQRNWQKDARAMQEGFISVLRYGNIFMEKQISDKMQNLIIM